MWHSQLSLFPFITVVRLAHVINPSLILPGVFTKYSNADAAVGRVSVSHFLRPDIVSSGDCGPDDLLFFHCSFLMGVHQEVKEERQVRFLRVKIVVFVF